MKRVAGPTLSILLLAGCAQSGTLVAVLTPEEGQSVGGVQLLDGDTGAAFQTIDQANAQVTARRGGIRTGELQGAAAIAESLEATLPRPPKIFILYFKSGTSDLADESSSLVDDLFSEVARRPGAEVEIVGHTDTMGEPESNDALSMQRAQAVQRLLIQLGLNGDIMRTIGRGERVPRVPTGDEVANPLNSRVEVSVR